MRVNRDIAHQKNCLSGKGCMWWLPRHSPRVGASTRLHCPTGRAEGGRGGRSPREKKKEMASAQRTCKAASFLVASNHTSHHNKPCHLRHYTATSLGLCRRLYVPSLWVVVVTRGHERETKKTTHSATSSRHQPSDDDARPAGTSRAVYRPIHTPTPHSFILTPYSTTTARAQPHLRGALRSWTRSTSARRAHADPSARARAHTARSIPAHPWTWTARSPLRPAPRRRRR